MRGFHEANTIHQATNGRLEEAEEAINNMARATEEDSSNVQTSAKKISKYMEVISNLNAQIKTKDY